MSRRRGSARGERQQAPAPQQALTVASEMPVPTAIEIRAATERYDRLMATARGDLTTMPMNRMLAPTTYHQLVLRIVDGYNTDPLFRRLVDRAIEFTANGSHWEVTGERPAKGWIESVDEQRGRKYEQEEEFWNYWARQVNVGVPNVIPGLDEVTRWAAKHLLLGALFVVHWELGTMRFGKRDFIVPKQITCYPASSILLQRMQRLFVEETIYVRMPADVPNMVMQEGLTIEAQPSGAVAGNNPLAGYKPLEQVGTAAGGEGVREAFALKLGWTPGDLATIRVGLYSETGQAVYPRPPFAALVPQFVMRQRLFASDLAILDGIIEYMMCVRPDQLVTTRRGHIPIAEVVVGDEVLTHRHRWRPVTEVFRRPYSGELVGLRPTNGMKGSRSSVWLTPNHPVLSRYRKKRVVWDASRGVFRWRVPNNADSPYASCRPQEPDPPRWTAAGDVEGGDLVLLPRLPQAVSSELPTLRMAADHLIKVPGGVAVHHPANPAKYQHWRVKPIPAEVVVTEAVAEVLGLYLAEGHVCVQTHHYNQWSTKSKLSPEQAQFVVESPDSGRSLARRFGVDKIVIQRIRRGLKRMKSRHGISRRAIHGIGFSFHERETELHDRVIQVMRDSFRLSPSRAGHGKGIQLIFCSGVVGETFAREFGEGAANKHAPRWLAEASPSIVAAWLRGLFWGDGCRRPDGTWALRIVSRELAHQVVDAVRSFGFHASLGCYRNWTHKGEQRVEGRPVYVVGISSRSGFDSLMSGGPLPTAVDDEMWVSARTSGREAYEGDVYNLEVEDDHSYVVNGLALHNCWKIGSKEFPPQPPTVKPDGTRVVGTIADVMNRIKAARAGRTQEYFLPYYVDLDIKTPDTATLLNDTKYAQSAREIFAAFGLLRLPGTNTRERMERIDTANFEEFVGSIRAHIRGLLQGVMAPRIIQLNPGKLTQPPTWMPNPMNTKAETYLAHLFNLAKLGRVSLRTLLRSHGLDPDAELRRIADELELDVDDLLDANVPTSYVQQTVQPPDIAGRNRDKLRQKGQPVKPDDGTEGAEPTAKRGPGRPRKETAITPGLQQGRPKEKLTAKLAAKGRRQ